MQTFSYMRRNSFDKRDINPFLLFIIAIVYESLTSIYIYFTPLLGVIFYYLLEHMEEDENFLKEGLMLLYISYFEIDKGLFLFSFLIFFVLFYNFAAKPITHAIHCEKCKIVLYVGLGYFGYFILNLFLAQVFNQSIPSFGIEYVIYIITDIILVFLLFT